MGSLQIIHGVNDKDISYHQTEMICQRILGNEAECIDGSRGATLLEVKKEGRPGVRFEIFGHGGESDFSFPSQVHMCTTADINSCSS
jgi:abhydrolase domain-containing protein 12